MVRGDITILGNNGAQVTFKNCTQFIKCIKKGNGTTINDGEDSDLVISSKLS